MTSPNHWFTSFVLILSALMAFTSLSTDIYLPAMPVMTADLHGNAELTITGFLIGFAIAQLIWGPIQQITLVAAFRCLSAWRCS
jgi:DHA1 family bicyclomycin/chloramphenicol resistance-like MFS transporter